MELIKYGVTDSNGLNVLYVMQEEDKELYSLWIAEGKPHNMDKESVRHYMESHELEGYSIAGTYEEVREDLKEVMNA